MHTNYLSSAIEEFSDQQMRFESHGKHIPQADSAAKRLNKPETPDTAVSERTLTLDELAKQFRVSTKTVSRWRKRGLVSRRFLFDGHKRLGFLQSSVDRFAELNEEWISRGSKFSQLTDEERKRIIELAQCLAKEGVYPTMVIKQTAKETGRSVETIRYTLKHFDLAHPGMAIFPHDHRLLNADTKREFYQQYCRGDSVQALAEQYYMVPRRIHSMINEMRVTGIVELPLDFINNEQFAGLGSEKKETDILGPLPDGVLSSKKLRVPGGLPPYLASLYEVPLLTREQEIHLFRKMNYLKSEASALRVQLDLSRPNSRVMDRIDKLYNESVAIKNQIIRANLRLVVSIAKRYVGPTSDFFELVSDGNISLIRAVEKFDFSLGNKFSTYASWAIMKNFGRTISDAIRDQGRFCTSHPEIFSTVEDTRVDRFDQISAQIQRESHVKDILTRLNDRERQIVTSRFGLTRGLEPLTLKQVGVAMGITKERVRQIEFRAMSKLRIAADEDRIE